MRYRDLPPWWPYPAVEVPLSPLAEFVLGILVDGLDPAHELGERGQRDLYWRVGPPRREVTISHGAPAPRGTTPT